MGMYATAKISVSVRMVEDVANELGLPKPQCFGDHCEMRLKDVRRWVKYCTASFHPIVAEEFYIIRAVMRNDASDYIYQATLEADDLQRTGKLAPAKRKDFLRRKTKEYRLYFV